VNADERSLARELRPLVFQLYYLVRRQAPQHQLTLTQGSVLRTLMRDGPQRIGVLAEAEGVKLPSMTDVVARLKRLGMVARSPDPIDGRAVLVSITEAGTRFYRELVQAREEFLHARLAALTGPDRQAIAAALPALRRLLDLDSEGMT
jgi:DNA-binding MarR family transcriptional regulator